MGIRSTCWLDSNYPECSHPNRVGHSQISPAYSHMLVDTLCGGDGPFIVLRNDIHF